MSFKITEVNINNFRGYKEESFRFDPNNDLVILSGPNGYGKTSFIDAVEWCLTGDVKRIREEAKARQDLDRIFMKKGLIRYKDTEEPVSVKVTFNMNGKTFSIKRQSVLNAINFTKEETEVNFTGDYEGETIDEIFNSKFEKSDLFYDHFICSYEKNLKFYQKGRKDFYDICKIYLGTDTKTDLFEERINGVINSSKQETERLRNDLAITEGLLDKQTQIENINNLINEYNGMDINNRLSSSIQEMVRNLNKLESRKNELKNLITISIIRDTNKEYYSYRGYLQKIAQYNKFKKEVYDKYNNYIDIIQKVEKYNYNEILSDIKELKDIKNTFEDFKDQFPIYEQLKNKIDSISFLSNDIISSVNKLLNIIKKIDDEYLEIKAEIEREKNSSEQTKAISILISNAEIWYKYVKENNECPLCKRTNLSLNDLKAAIKITAESQDLRAKELTENLKSEKTLILNSNNITKDVLNILNNEIERLLNIKREIVSCFSALEEYKVKCNEFGIDVYQLRLFNLNAILDDLKEKMENDEGAKKAEILNFDIAYLDKEIENNKKTIENLSKGFDKGIIENIEKNIEQKKVEILDKIIDFIKQCEYIQKKKDIENQIYKIEERINKANSLITRIKKSESDYEAIVFKNLEEVINNIIKKINRHTNFGVLKLNRTHSKSTNINMLIEGTNFTNLISAGQLTSIALSLFISLAMTSNASKFKAYFMDDPIQSLDDVNILSFIDLLRYQLKSETGFAEQLFISTCDEDFEKLLKYKMKHFEINVKHLQFIDYGRYITVE